jgi:hypothetical protein
MKQPTILLALCLALTALPAYAASHHDELVYIGTHGSGKDQQDKAQQGIYAARFDAQTGHFTPPPTWTSIPSRRPFLSQAMPVAL